ncbi:MAG TPA: DsbA family oxidoreductase [Micropepsaceae bacterium]|nr:DsbA family oxidoreductase [Micropepsaceae bacterium]
MKRIPVSITSDFVCPWCFIGERRLARAAARLSEELREEVRLDISWRPFELNPNFPAEGIDRRAYRIAKFGSWEHSQRLDAHVIEAGKPDGAIFNYDRISRTPNTRRAHRLVWWTARRGGNQDLLVDRLFEGYFVEGRDLSAPAELASIAAKADLPDDAVAAFLAGDEGADEVIAAENYAHRNGINGVPDFRMGSIGFSGAQPIEIMTEALRRASTKAPVE